MEGAPGIPLDVMLWLSLGVLALGLLTLIPVWWSNQRGWYLTMTPQEARVRKTGATLTFSGALGVFCTGMAAAQRNFSAPVFIAMCVVWCIGLLAFAFAIDARARRRH